MLTGHVIIWLSVLKSARNGWLGKYKNTLTPHQPEYSDCRQQLIGCKLLINKIYESRTDRADTVIPGLIDDRDSLTLAEDWFK